MMLLSTVTFQCGNISRLAKVVTHLKGVRLRSVSRDREEVREKISQDLQLGAVLLVSHIPLYVCITLNAEHFLTMPMDLMGCESSEGFLRGARCLPVRKPHVMN